MASFLFFPPRARASPRQAASAYPAWLWALSKPLRTLRELRNATFEELPSKDQARFFDLSQRVVIKEQNTDLAGSK